MVRGRFWAVLTLNENRTVGLNQRYSVVNGSVDAGLSDQLVLAHPWLIFYSIFLIFLMVGNQYY